MVHELGIELVSFLEAQFADADVTCTAIEPVGLSGSLLLLFFLVETEGWDF